MQAHKPKRSFLGQWWDRIKTSAMKPEEARSDPGKPHDIGGGLKDEPRMTGGNSADNSQVLKSSGAANPSNQCDHPTDAKLESLITPHSETTTDKHVSGTNLANSLEKRGENYIRRFERLAEAGDADKGVGYLIQAVSLLPKGHPNLLNSLDTLGNIYMRRFQRNKSVFDAEGAIEYWTRAINLITDEHKDLPRFLTNLGSMHGSRFSILGKSHDIDTAIEYMTRTILLTPDDHPILCQRLASLGRFHWIRFQLENSEKPDDLNKTLEYMTRAISLAPEDHQDLAMWLNNLSISLEHRFVLFDEVGDLENAIAHMFKSVALSPEGQPELPNRLNILGTLYMRRFDHFNQVYDINKAIEYWNLAVSAAPEGNTCHCLLLWLDQLGSSYQTRYQQCGESPHDVEKAIEHRARAMKLTPEGSTELPRRLNYLAASYHSRFDRFGTVGDIDQTVECNTRAVSLTPEDDAKFVERLVRLSRSYQTRFRRFGKLGDIDKAIGHSTRVTALNSENHPLPSERLDHLSILYVDRYERLGEIDDVNRAIESSTRAVALTSEGHPNLPVSLSNLGHAYESRFRQTGVMGDIDRAIEYKTRAISLSQEGYSDLPKDLAILGVSYVTRFQHLERVEDISSAIECMTRSVALTSEGHLDLPMYLYNLGCAYHSRFQHSGELSDNTKAFENMNRAIELFPQGHPELPAMLGNLGNVHYSRFKSEKTQASIISAIDCYHQASKCSTGNPQYKLIAARTWGQIASRHHISDNVQAYQVALNLVPQVVWFGSTIDKRYHNVHEVGDLAMEAATAAVGSKNYELALEWLEQARLIVWNQTLQLRNPVDKIYATNPTLAKAFEQVAQRLYFAGMGPEVLISVNSNTRTPEQATQEHHQLAEQYDDLLCQIREIPGLDGFLKPRTAAELLTASWRGPVVVVNCYQNGCDALIILAGNPNIMHVPLPKFSDQGAQHLRSLIERSLSWLGIRERGVRRPVPPETSELGDELETVLLTLWIRVAHPILKCLGYLQTPPSDDLPHITWCLTGALSGLPLHAAGCYDHPRHKVSDFAISSYTPTLGALLTSRDRAASLGPNPSTSIIAIGQANTPGTTSLPGTLEELTHIQSHVCLPNKYSELLDSNATPEAVLEGMENHSWVHLACHAHQNLSNPDDTGFFLHGGTLNITSIRQRQFEGKGVAFLSACQTAMGDKKLPDEAIHLASGMLLAGYPSVIATLWSVMDQDAPIIADIVYGQLIKDGRTYPEHAARALHRAVATLRERVGYQNFARWVPYIHMGV